MERGCQEAADDVVSLIWEPAVRLVAAPWHDNEFPAAELCELPSAVERSDGVVVAMDY